MGEEKPKKEKKKKSDSEATKSKKDSDKKPKKEDSDKKPKKEKKKSKTKEDADASVVSEDGEEIKKAEVGEVPDEDAKTSSKKKPSKSSSSDKSDKKKKKDKIATKSTISGRDDGLQMSKMFASTAKEIADALYESESEAEEDDGLVPIPAPDNPPMDKFTLIIKQPNDERLRMPAVDPANTNIRMVREFIEKNYYKGNVIPRLEQRQLLYRLKPIFDEEGDYNVDDAKTLADHGLTKDGVVIELSKMHVYVISPSTKKSMMINNVDPMNDVIFDMKKLAMDDGYPVTKLRLLHKEAGGKEIKQGKNMATFFECGVKHNHTLILEWPKIVISIKLPIFYETDKETKGREIVEDPTTGRKFQLFDFTTQAELDKVQVIHDFISNQTNIPQDQQTLILSPKPEKSKKPPKTKPLSSATKIIAEYKVNEGDIVELKPFSLKVHWVGGPDGKKSTTLADMFYPTDPVEAIKAAIENGKGVDDGIPSIPKTNLSIKSLNKDGTTKKELKSESQTLQSAGIVNDDELEVEKTKITIKVTLPTSHSSTKGGRILEFGVNPKLDDLETIKEMLSEKTGVPKELLPPLLFKGDNMDNDADGKKLVDFGLTESDLIDVAPITLNVNVKGRETVSLEGVDPFNDTIEDIKKRLGPDDLDILPVEMIRLRYSDKNLGEDNDEDDSSSSSPTIYDCQIKDQDTLDLEKSKIDLCIHQPNGEPLEFKNVDPRKDDLGTIEEFLSDNYYHGKDKDGSIPEDQLRPLLLKGERMDNDKKSLHEYGLIEDGEVIGMEPMTVNVVYGPDEATKTLDNIDPMNHNIHDIRKLAASDDTPLDNLALLHKEAEMKYIDDPDKTSYYDNAVKSGDTLVIERKPITVTIKLPKVDDDGEAPILTIQVNPDKDDLDKIRNAIHDHIGFPVQSQKLNKLLKDAAGANEDDPSAKQGLDASGDTKLSSPELNLVDDCTIELEPMTINVKTFDGEVIPLQVSPASTIEDVKKRLANGKVDIPSNKQRLLNGDGEELGGDEDAPNSGGSGQPTLMDLDLEDGAIILLEKSKISLTVKMPYGMEDVEVVVDPKKGCVNDIRQQIFEATGLAKEYQKRLKFGEDCMDDGYRHNDGENENDEANRTSLSNFDLKEFDCLQLDSMRVTIVKIPEEKSFILEGLDPMNNVIWDLKKLAAAEIDLPAHKQRMMQPETFEEYVGKKESTEKLHEYGIKDGDTILLENCKINFRVVLPDTTKMEFFVDPRKDDLQKVRDHVFRKYYKNRKVPDQDMREMTSGKTGKVLDSEPGETKLIDLGFQKDNDRVTLKPCYITIETPRRLIYCPNADPFQDTLTSITKFVEYEGIKTDGLFIQFQGKKMKDMKSVLYDLNITDGETLKFFQK